MKRATRHRWNQEAFTDFYNRAVILVNFEMIDKFEPESSPDNPANHQPTIDRINSRARVGADLFLHNLNLPLSTRTTSRKPTSRSRLQE